ncbi:hypothetical protein FQR65_LT20989 [Abscondita terminalis]|nr:hypothetical protein FQR65_LT20989 [Abscondita terminalis]
MPISGTAPCKRLIDRVVNDLPRQLHKATRIGVPDYMPAAFTAPPFKTLKNGIGGLAESSNQPRLGTWLSGKDHPTLRHTTTSWQATRSAKPGAASSNCRVQE